LLTADERRRKADKLITMIRELREPPCSHRHWSIGRRKRRTKNQRIPEASDRDLPVLDESRNLKI
jgi:hypothetical protein